MEFVLQGKTSKSKDELKKIIQRMGGKVGTKIHDKVAAIISTEEEVERLGSRMQEAKDLGIQVLPEDFLEDVKKGNAISLISSKSLCDWGTDVSYLWPFDQARALIQILSFSHASESPKRKLENP